MNNQKNHLGKGAILFVFGIIFFLFLFLFTFLKKELYSVRKEVLSESGEKGTHENPKIVDYEEASSFSDVKPYFLDHKCEIKETSIEWEPRVGGFRVSTTSPAALMQKALLEKDIPLCKEYREELLAARKKWWEEKLQREYEYTILELEMDFETYKRCKALK